MSFTLNVYGDSSVGKQRDHNEDSFGIFFNLKKKWINKSDFTVTESNESKGIFIVVADGMGGTNAGEVASKIAVDTINKEIESLSSNITQVDEYRNYLTSLLMKAHKRIVSKAKFNKEMKGMGTTMLLGWIINNYLYIVWSGDSRCYYYNKNRDKNLAPFTEDHSLVWLKVKDGELTPEEARLSDESNLILQSLGDNHQKPIPGFIWTKLEANDRILFCSDGLNSMLSDVGIQQILDFSNSTRETCHSLINAAINAGGNENITVVLVDVISTESLKSQNKHSAARKKFSRRNIFLIVLLIILAVFMVSQNKILEFNHGINKNMQSVISDSHDISMESKEAKIESIDMQSNKEDIIMMDSSQLAVDSNVLHGKQKLANDSNNQIDSLTVKNELTNALKSILAMRIKIAQFEPGGISYNKSFYDSKNADFNLFKTTLDSLYNQIDNVGQINKNTVVLLKNKEIAGTLCEQINEQLSRLNRELKIAIETI